MVNNSYRRFAWGLAGVTIFMVIGGFAFAERPISCLFWIVGLIGAIALMLFAAKAELTSLKSRYGGAGYSQIPKRAILGALTAPIVACSAALIISTFLLSNDTAVASLRLIAGFLAFFGLFTAFVGKK